jgi:hypothetical protein
LSLQNKGRTKTEEKRTRVPETVESVSVFSMTNEKWKIPNGK